MATLRHVQYSQTGEQPQEAPAQIAEATIVNDLRVNAEQQEKVHVFKLVGNTRKGGIHIPGIEDMRNPKTGLVERARLLAGVTTIWQSEQKDLSPDYVKNNQRNLSFTRGTKILRIPDYDTTALEFARLSKHNVGSKSKRTGSNFEFYEYDPAKEQEELLKREEFELEMAILAKGQKPELMRKHALFLGIRMIDELGNPKTDDGIRREYVIYAKRQPDYFQKTLNSREVEIGWMVRKGIAESLIEINKEPGKVYWANNGGFVCSIPPNTDATKYLIDLASTNSDDGKRFLDQLQTLLK